MNKLLLFVVMLLIVSCSERTISKDKLVYRNGTAYAVNEEEPYSGKALGDGGFYSYGPRESTYENGKLHGHHIAWHKNGQKRQEGMYFHANPDYGLKKDGIWTEWYENGQMKLQWTYKNGVKHGTSKWWDKNGQMGYNDMYKNGILVK